MNIVKVNSFYLKIFSTFNEIQENISDRLQCHLSLTLKNIVSVSERN
jgi:hypothetical protein